MTKLSGSLVKVFLITAAAGVGLHFLYGLLNCLPVALIAPVNESIWEHIKLLFWPFLVAALWCSRKLGLNNLAAWWAALLTICTLEQGIGWIVHVPLGVESIVFDIGLYLVLVALGFWLAVRWQGAAGHEKLWCGLVVLLLLAICWFTFSPPDTTLFADPALADAWYSLPC